MKVAMLVYRVAGEPLGNRQADEALALSAAGHDVRAVKFTSDSSIPHEQWLGDVPVKTLFFTGLDSKFVTVFALPYLYVRLLSLLYGRNDDGLYCDHPFLLPFAVVVGNLTEKHVVYDCYELFSRQVFKEQPWLRRCMEAIENVFVRFVDHALVIDTSDDALYRRFDQLTDVEVLYNVPSLAAEAEMEIAAGGQLELANGMGTVDLDALGSRPVIVYVGGIAIKKGALKMVETLSLVRQKYSDTRLLYVGSYKDDVSRQRVETYVREHGLGDAVTHLGWLPTAQMLAVVRVSDVGLALYQPVGHYPKAGMGQGRKIFTYMQAVVPVVGPDFGELGAVVEREHCGTVVDPEDPDAIASAVCSLLADEERATSMGANGRRAVEDQYNWERETKKLIAAFEP